MILIRVTAVAAHANIEAPWPRGNLDRAQIVHQLCQVPGRHLVIVRYDTNSAIQRDPGHEFVYNSADIDHAKIVWARDMGESNQQLINYFRDRQVWLLNGDDPRPKLSAYSLSPAHVLANSSNIVSSRQ